MVSLSAVIEACVIAVSLSVDAFLASFSYGSNKIKIPLVSVHIINIICSAVVGLSFVVGSIAKEHIPNQLSAVMCFLILLFIGLTKLLDSATKSIIRKHNNLNKQLKFQMFNFNFILNLYANPEDADVDNSKTISPKEAASLAVAMSLDGLAVGFGAALVGVDGLAVFLFSLISNGLAVVFGCGMGNKIADAAPVNVSWLGGCILIILAVSKLSP